MHPEEKIDTKALDITVNAISTKDTASYSTISAVLDAAMAAIYSHLKDNADVVFIDKSFNYDNLKYGKLKIHVEYESHDTIKDE